MTSGASDSIFKNFFSRSSRATGPNTRVPTGSPASLISTAAFESNLIYVPSRRRCSFRVRTITAFTTVPFLVWPSGAASFTAAVITSPRPAFNPVEPPSGRIICSLRAPELSATSSIDLIITAITSVSPCVRGLHSRSAISRRLQPQLPERSRPCGQYLSISSASASTAAASLPDAPRRPHEPDWFRRAHKTSCCARLRACRRDAPSYASPSRRWFCACGWRRLLPRFPCAAPAPARSGLRFQPLSFLRCAGRGCAGRGAPALPEDGLDPGNVFAQAANLFQALGLAHVQLKLQLEQLVRQIVLLMGKLFFGQISDFVCIHKIALIRQLSAKLF